MRNGGLFGECHVFVMHYSDNEDDGALVLQSMRAFVEAMLKELCFFGLSIRNLLFAPLIMIARTTLLPHTVEPSRRGAEHYAQSTY